MVETIAAVAAVAAGNLVIVRPLQGQVRGRTVLKLPLQDPTHHVAPPTGRTCTKDRGIQMYISYNNNHLHQITLLFCCF